MQAVVLIRFGLLVCFTGLLTQPLQEAVAAPPEQSVTSEQKDSKTSQPSVVFGVIGDQPYGDYFEPHTQALINQINQHPLVSMIFHTGDIKGGGEPCSDELLRRRLLQLESSPKPVVYAVGDNEWTDCHRKSNGNRDPLERLDFLRQTAFSEDKTLGISSFAVSSQRRTGYPEHQMWKTGHVLFLTLNVPGSNNNLDNPSSRNASQETILRESQHRMEAIEGWLLKGAEWMVSDPSILQTVVLIQGNPFDGSGKKWPLSLPFGPSDGYQPFRQALAHFMAITRKPLLLIHGDTHRFRWDQPNLVESSDQSENLTRQTQPNSVDNPSTLPEPLSSKQNALTLRRPLTDEDKIFIQKNFYRLEGWGHPFVNRWIKVSIHENSTHPFTVEDLEVVETVNR